LDWDLEALQECHCLGRGVAFEFPKCVCICALLQTNNLLQTVTVEFAVDHDGVLR